MSLFRRGSMFWFEFVYNGVRYRESTGTANEQRAAKVERKRRGEIEEAAHGIRRTSSPTLLSVAADEWLTTRQPMWAVKTYSAARLDVMHLKQHLGPLLLSDIRDRDVSAYVVTRQSEGASPKTVRNEIGSLRSIMKKYKLWAQLKDEGVRLPKGRDESTGLALSLDDEAKLMAACAASRSRSLLPVVTLALCTGCRHDELRLLKWMQIDFVNEAIKVGKSKTAAGAGRAVPLNARGLEVLRTWAAQFPERRPQHFLFPSEKVGLSGNDEIAEVFDTDPTKAITSWKTAWKTAKAASGVECRFHDLRHTVCTRLLESGQPFAVVADIMGWSAATAVRMTRVYGHIGASAKRSAMAALEPKPEPTKLQAPRKPRRPSSTLVAGPARVQ